MWAHGAGLWRAWPTSPSTPTSRRSSWRTRQRCRPCSTWPRYVPGAAAGSLRCRNVLQGVVGLTLWGWGAWKRLVVPGGLKAWPVLSIVGVMDALLPLQSEDRSVLYAVASTLVNCTNSYDHEEPDPQMLELAKYAKQHIPEQHPKVGRALCMSGACSGAEPRVPRGPGCP